MLPDDALRQLTRDRALEREHEAEAERLATPARRLRSRPDEGMSRIALIGAALATRRHALQ